MQRISDAVVYAAGFGTRMGELTRNTPKPLLTVHGRPLIDLAMDRLRAAGVSHFHINTHYLAPQIAAHFAIDGDVEIYDEADGPYETGGTLKALAPHLPETVITQNADAMYVDALPISQIMGQWHDDIDALLILVPRARAINATGVGDFFWTNGELTRRGEAASAPFIFTSTQIIRPKIATQFAERVFSTNLIWDRLIASGRIAAYVHDADWIDFGDARALEAAHEVFAP